MRGTYLNGKKGGLQPVIRSLYDSSGDLFKYMIYKNNINIIGQYSSQIIP